MDVRAFFFLTNDISRLQVLMPGEHRPSRGGFLSFLGGFLTVVASSGGRGSIYIVL